MKALILDNSPAPREEIAYILLSFGVEGIGVSSRQEALSNIQNDKDLKVIILDVDKKELEGYELIEELRKNADTSHLKIVVQTIQSNKEFVVKMVELGVNAYLLKPLIRENAEQRLGEIVAATGQKQQEKRQHIRVNPDPGELLRVHFKLADGSKLISGKIRNISMGGLAVELFNPPNADQLAQGTHISKLQFALGAKELTPSGTVVIYKEKIIALRFGSINADAKHSIARYIYKRLA